LQNDINVCPVIFVRFQEGQIIANQQNNRVLHDVNNTATNVFALKIVFVDELLAVLLCGTKSEAQEFLHADASRPMLGLQFWGHPSSLIGFPQQNQHPLMTPSAFCEMMKKLLLTPQPKLLDACIPD